jgi:hypothetical protein
MAEKTNMSAPEAQNTKMVKVRALRDLTYRTGKKVTQVVGVREVQVDERVYLKAGDTADVPAEDVKELTSAFVGPYAFSGERVGDEARQRHAMRRAEVVAA